VQPSLFSNYLGYLFDFCSSLSLSFSQTQTEVSRTAFQEDVMADISSFDSNILITGPSFHVDLAALDARHPVHYSRRLLIFRCTSAAQRNLQLDALKTGLRALLSRCPVLGGTIVPLRPSEAKAGNEDWRTIVPGPGIELITQDLSSTLPSFSSLSASKFPSQDLPYELLVPVPVDLDNSRPFAACKVQFSAIAGGSILTFSMSHSVADGSATNELMRVLSEATRLAQSGSSSVALEADMGLDRHFLRNITSSIPFKISDHPAFMSPPPASDSQTQPPPHPFEATSPEIPIVLHIPAASLTQLKADATSPSGPPISTHDALSALIWRSVLLIRSRRSQAIPDSTIGHIFMPSDARRHLNLPMSYIGNAVYQLTAAIDLDTLLSPSGLQEAAGAIRKAILAVKPELVASYMAELKERWVDWGFMVGISTVGVAMGTDWTSGTLYSDDWGEAFGSVVKYRYPGEEGGYNSIYPRLPDGSAEVLVGVMPDELDVLRGDECFGRYLVQR
jgi:trichothecene 3-O-acetyltransferase